MPSKRTADLAGPIRRRAGSPRACTRPPPCSSLMPSTGTKGTTADEPAPYATDQHRTPWGSAVSYDDAGCEGVRSFVVHNARWWVRNFRVDGLRLDAVHAIHDEGARHILADVAAAVRDEGVRLGRP